MTTLRTRAQVQGAGLQMRGAIGLLAVLVTAIMIATLGSGPSAAAAAGDGGRGAPPSKAVTAQEKHKLKNTPVKRIVRDAKPLAVGKGKGQGQGQGQAPQPAPQSPDGPEERHAGAAPAGTTDTGAPAPSTSASTAAATSQNGAWPGAYYSNPNAQVGKLYFDINPGSATDWRHCSGTAVNSENKSLVITAGHCVYSPDPDGNGTISGNGYWHQSFMFCPGYESGCRLGTWNYRQVSTTWSWFGGYGSAKRYDFRDDVAVLLVSPNSRGYLVNAVGGQGITFNASTGLYRYAFGYPASDWRWPEYSYSGHDLIYCPGYSYNDGSIPGTMRMSCTMTGGSSGGPWLSYIGSNWIGYVNSVNSHKPYGGRYMNGPYFDSPESSLFSYWRNR